MDVTGSAWRTSSYSGSNGGACVEIGTRRPGRGDPGQQAPGRPAACFRRRHMDGICRTGEGERLNLVRAFPPWP